MSKCNVIVIGTPQGRIMSKIKKILFLVLTIFFPWLVLFIEDRPGAAVLALVLQVTIFGWPFAIIWAWGVVKESEHIAQPSTQGKT